MQDHKRESLDKQVENFRKLQEQKEEERKQKREQAEIEKQVKVGLRVEQEKEKLTAKKEVAIRKDAEQKNVDRESSGNTSRRDKQNHVEPKRKTNGVMPRGEPANSKVGRAGMGVVRRKRQPDCRTVPEDRKLSLEEKEEQMLNKLMGIKVSEEKTQAEEEKFPKGVERDKQEKMMDYIMRRK